MGPPRKEQNANVCVCVCVFVCTCNVYVLVHVGMYNVIVSCFIRQYVQYVTIVSEIVLLLLFCKTSIVAVVGICRSSHNEICQLIGLTESIEIIHLCIINI